MLGILLCFCLLLVSHSLAEDSFLGIKQNGSICLKYDPNDFPCHFTELLGQADRAALLERAMISVIRQVKLPYMTSPSDGSGRPKMRTGGFLKELCHRARQIDPKMRVYLGGGVTRSILGYLYQAIHRAKVKDPKISTRSLLEAIIQGTVKSDDWWSTTVLGIGSDLDVYIDSPLAQEDPKLEESIRGRVAAFISSAERHMGVPVGGEHWKLKNMVFPEADVNLVEHMREIWEHGGSSLDMLLLEVETGRLSGPGHRHESGRMEGLIDDLLSCRFDFYPATPASKSKANLPKQAVRAIRGLLELPSFHLKAPSHQRMIAILQDMLQKPPGPLSMGICRQVEKMIRNARFKAGNNRLLGNNRDIPILFMQNLANLPSTYQSIEQFLPDRPTTFMNQLKEDLPLLDTIEFITKWTWAGHLWLGLPTIDHLLPTVRNGGFASSRTIPGWIGDGIYTAPDPLRASKLTSTCGVTKLAIRKDLVGSLRIVDWDRLVAQKHSSFSLPAFPDDHATPIEWLRNVHSIDIVVIPSIDAVIVLWADILAFPECPIDLIERFRELMQYQPLLGPDCAAVSHGASYDAKVLRGLEAMIPLLRASN